MNLYAGLANPPTVFQLNKYTKGGSGGNVADSFIADPESDDEDGTVLVTVNASSTTYAVTYGSSSHSFSIAGTGGAVGGGGNVVMESVLPNPVGDDTQLEEVTLRNRGNAVVNLVGWTLMDRAGLIWELDSMGSLAAATSATIRRNGMEMSLNNAGEQITLRDAGNVVRDTFEYRQTSEGVTIQTGH